MTIDDLTETVSFDALPDAVRARLLDEMRECGAECARQAYEAGASEFTTTDRGDIAAVRALLDKYGCDREPLNGYAHPDHEIWRAFWDGAASAAR